MAHMKQSLPGLFRNTEVALRSSSDDYACAMAFSVGQLIDNLRHLKNGTATVEEFFEYYVFDSDRGSLADSVDRKKFDCMKDEIDDEEEEAA